MCQHGDHAQLRRPAVFHRLKAIGTMRIPATATEPAYTLVMANCPDCGTTLALEVNDETPRYPEAE